MPEVKNKIEDKYRESSIRDEDYKALFGKIISCEKLAPKGYKAKKKKVTENARKSLANQVDIRTFIVDLAEPFNTAEYNFDDLYNSEGLKPNAETFCKNGTQNRAIKSEAFSIAFSATAQLNKLSLPEVMVRLLDYCNEYNLEIVELREYEKLINRLKGEYGSGKNPAPRYNPEDKLYKRILDLAERATYQRSDVLCEIENFIFKAPSSSGYLKVLGGAGSGKTSLLAQAVQTFTSSNKAVCLYHFNSISTRATNDSIDLIKSVYQQLDDFYGLEPFAQEYADILISSKGFETFVSDVLEYVSRFIDRQCPLLLTIDALDEIDGNDASKLQTRQGLNWQCIPKTLPANVYILVSSRSFEQQNYDGFVIDLDLSPDSTFQIKDIEGYARQQIQTDKVQQWIAQQDWDDESTEQPDAQFFHDIVKRSEYAFIYLYHVFDAIDDYTRGNLPNGINAYYEQQYARLVSDQHDTVERKRMLAAITNFTPDVSIDIVSVYCGVELDRLDGTLRDWELIRLIRREAEQQDIFLSLFHKSFYDFLTDSKHEAAKQIERIRTGAKRFKRLTSYLIAELSGAVPTSHYKTCYSEKRQRELFRVLFKALLENQNHTELQALLINPNVCVAYKEVMGRQAVRDLILWTIQLHGAIWEYSHELAKEFLRQFMSNVIKLGIVPHETVGIVTTGQDIPFKSDYRSLKWEVLFSK